MLAKGQVQMHQLTSGATQRTPGETKKPISKVVSVNSTPRQMGRSNSNKETKKRNMLQTIPDSNQIFNKTQKLDAKRHTPQPQKVLLVTDKQNQIKI